MSLISKRLRQQFDKEDPYNPKGMTVGLARIKVLASDMDRLLIEHEQLERKLENYKKYISGSDDQIYELERQLDNALRLVNNWLSWCQQGRGSLGALENESRAALEAGKDE